jgi:hypothetical protein
MPLDYQTPDPNDPKNNPWRQAARIILIIFGTVVALLVVGLLILFGTCALMRR